MNYYPTNYYSNYPYQGGYNQQQQQMQYQPAQQNTLNGKIVDSAEVARITDVPFGGYGIFPKADLSEVYIKTWNSNGTTSVTTYKPTVEEAKDENEYKKYIEANNILEERVKKLEEKIETLLSNKKENIEKRKEISANAY